MIPMPRTNQDLLPANDPGDRRPQEDNEGILAQEMYNALPDASLHECRVEMVPLDAIYVEGDQHDDDLVNALAHSIGLIGLQNPPM